MPRLCQGPGHRCHTTVPPRELIRLALLFCAPCLGQIGGRYFVGRRVVGDEVTLSGGGKTRRASKSKLD